MISYTWDYKAKGQYSSLKPQVPTFELRATIFEADVVTSGDGGRCDLVAWLDSGTFLPGLLLVVGQSLRGSGSMKTLSAKLTRRLYRREIIEKYRNKYRCFSTCTIKPYNPYLPGHHIRLHFHNYCNLSSSDLL